MTGLDLVFAVGLFCCENLRGCIFRMDRAMSES